MARRILAIIAIYLATCVAWMALAVLTEHRTHSTQEELRTQVADLYGEEHHTMAPEVYYEAARTIVDDSANSPGDMARGWNEKVVHSSRVTVVPESSDILVNLELDQRRKGLLWYSTYRVGFHGDYLIKNNTSERREYVIGFTFPTTQAIYDNFVFRVGHQDVALEGLEEGVLSSRVPLAPGEEKAFTIGYDSRGLNRWLYVPGRGVSQVKDFTLTMVTDFKAIDFPPGTISPTSKAPVGDGWELVWRHDNLISGFTLGIKMPSRINPGPLASQITLFAPVSLLFFFFVIFILSVLRDIKIHPMNYFFLAAAFFSFHLLFAYLADHMDVHLAFAISSAVSVALVVSYLRLVVGPRFAFREAAIAQLVYLVLFSYAHFFKGFTGLCVTVGSILTLAALMQFTGRIDWEERFRR
ncbi:MAG: inner membrane CreD family protein [Bacillota bacterium]